MDARVDLEGLLAELGEVPDEALERAMASLDPPVSDSITYFGARLERELARFADQLAHVGASPVVADASATLGRMLDRLKSLQAGLGPRPSFLQRLIRRTGGELTASVLDALEGELDQLAGRLQSFTGPLLTESLGLERREARLRASLQTVAAYLKGGLQVLEAVEDPHWRRELLQRLQDLATARTIGLQALQTLTLLVASRRRLHERVEFVLNHALPLWHRHAALVRRELKARDGAAADELASANAELAAALGGGPDATRR